jgi:flagellar protein FliS
MSLMRQQKFLNQYQQTSIETGMENATPHKLVSLLYGGALDNLALAKGAMQRKDFELKSKKINKVILIIGSLRSGLDMENGREASNNFEVLYSYINRKLLEASTKNNLQILEEVTELVKEIRSGWDLMPDNFKKASNSQINSVKVAKKG